MSSIVYSESLETSWFTLGEGIFEIVCTLFQQLFKMPETGLLQYLIGPQEQLMNQSLGDVYRVQSWLNRAFLTGRETLVGWDRGLQLFLCLLSSAGCILLWCLSNRERTFPVESYEKPGYAERGVWLGRCQVTFFVCQILAIRSKVNLLEIMRGGMELGGNCWGWYGTWKSQDGSPNK